MSSSKGHISVYAENDQSRLKVNLVLMIKGTFLHVTQSTNSVSHGTNKKRYTFVIIQIFVTERESSPHLFKKIKGVDAALGLS